MQDNHAWASNGTNGFHNSRFPWVARTTTRKNLSFIGRYLPVASMTLLCIFTPSMYLSGSVQHAACWTYYFACCSLLETILIATMDALLTAPATAGVPPFQIRIPPSRPDTTLLPMTSSTTYTDHHPHHHTATKGAPESPTSPAAPSPTPPPHLLLSAPSTHWESFQSVEKPNINWSCWSSRNLHVNICKKQQRSQTTPTVRHWTWRIKIGLNYKLAFRYYNPACKTTGYWLLYFSLKLRNWVHHWTQAETMWI